MALEVTGTVSAKRVVRILLECFLILKVDVFLHIKFILCKNSEVKKNNFFQIFIRLYIQYDTKIVLFYRNRFSYIYNLLRDSRS